jgi:branched-chain amino acid transport system ATP-binding protein
VTTGIVEVDEVTKRFGALTVVEALSFSLADGEALGIVGPNGAGKTTTLNLVAGDVRADTGRVVIGGQDVTTWSADRRCRLGVGRTAQVPRPFEGLTVFENVLVGAVHGAPGRDGRRVERGQTARAAACADLLEQVDLLGRANVRAAELSLMERKRLELARALATEPKVLLLDEIAGGLTEVEVLELVETIKRIRASGISIIWIEHIVHALLKVVDRILAMDYGRKLIEGDPHEVMASDEVRNVYLGADDEVLP